jgi:TfoX/Sxy family transcriptional regulator of competence genes
MAYDNRLAGRIRDCLAGPLQVEEKRMMGGLTFMVNGKMCVGIFKDDLMCRIAPEEYELALTRKGCREMTMGQKVMKGFVFVGPEGVKTDKQLNSWIKLCLAYNSKAKASKKRN